MKQFSSEEDPEMHHLHAILNGKSHQVLRHLTALSFQEDVREKIATAINEIRIEGIGFKRRRIEERCVCASTLGDLTKFDTHQKDLQICCHLPPGMKLHGLHVSLQVKAFGNFLDAMDQRSSRFTKLACELVLVCSNAYVSEEKFCNATRPLVVKLVEGLGCVVDRFSSEEADSRKAVTSDCTILFVKDGVRIPLASFEMKRDIAGSSSNPDIQNIGYYIKFQKKIAAPAPLLLVSMAGFSHMQVYGGTWNDDDMCYDPLSLPLSLLFVPSDPLNTIQNVAVMLQSIHGAIVDLKAYYYDNTRVYHGPYFMHEKNLHHAKKLRNKERVFEAEMDGKPVVVKFSRLYGQDAHTLLAEKHLAPDLISCEKIAGGWIAIIMKKIDGVDLPSPLPNTTKASLKEAIDILHQNNFVHGDCRPQNIMMTSDDKVCLLDFDWAGTVGSAYYPSDINLSSTCGWHTDVTPGGLIKIEHDVYQFEKMITDTDIHE